MSDDSMPPDNNPNGFPPEMFGGPFFEPPKPQPPKPTREEKLQALFAELNAMIGMNPVKEDIAALKSMVRFRKARKDMGIAANSAIGHIVFTGNPGTGKTTVARLIGKIYKEMGVLPEGHMVEVDRGDLVGGYVGQTALKTQKVIDAAMGGILFIDEAYALSPANMDKDFGAESIATILKAMEDNRDNFVVIFAGYPDLMRQFIESNPGLKSRCSTYIHFDDYNGMELLQIFDKMTKESGFKASTDVREAVGGILERAKIAGGKNFGNGRDVRTIVEKLEKRIAARLDTQGAFDNDKIDDLTEEMLMTIQPEDLAGLENEYIPVTEDMKSFIKRPIGFQPPATEQDNTPKKSVRPKRRPIGPRPALAI
ncbi:MAG TPA: hypothetical protein DCW68_00135 [Rhodospirillaceae bacterium]|nr:MAG: hypothetical protein A2018_01450 [Alphaproteobacteria bacterium GWF2_58_20]HAU28508.1 hypothetical protein [Rhodospirillaceae bacterium]